jgi:tricorn protease
MNVSTRLLQCFFILLLTSQFINAQGTRLLRQPDISNNNIVFAYGGDIWVTSKRWWRGT